MSRRWISVPIAVLLVAATAGCGSDDNGSKSTNGATTPTTAAAATTSGGSGSSASSSPSTSTAGSTGASTPAASGESYKIGYAGDFTGSLAGFGVPMINGFSTYVDTVNASGGVNGRKVEVLQENYEADVNKARVAIENMKQEGALGIFGGLSGNVWGPMAEIAKRDKVSQFTVGVTDDQLVPPQDFVYGSQIGAATNAEIELQFAKKQFPDIKNVAIVAFHSAYTETFIQHLQDGAKANGWTVVANEEIATTATDASAQADKINAAKPDVVLAALIDPITPLGVNALRAKGYTGPIVNFSGGEAEATFKTLDDTGYYAVRSYSYPQDPTVPGAVEMLKQANTTGHTEGLDVTWFSQGYVQAMIAVQALKSCADPCTAEAYNDALTNLGSVDTQGLSTGPVELSPQKHRAVISGVVYTWDDSTGRTVAKSDPIEFNS